MWNWVSDLDDAKPEQSVQNRCRQGGGGWHRQVESGVTPL